LAKQLKQTLDSDDKQSLHLDGDVLRVIFNVPYVKENFTKEYRIEQTRGLQKLTEHISSQGIDVIISTVNPYRSVRQELKSRNANMMEIYVVNNGLHVRENFAVVDFEEPQYDFIKIDTNGKTVDESFNILYHDIIDKQIKIMRAESDQIRNG
jgi:adenylylsulfate kinase-like enzyme